MKEGDVYRVYIPYFFLLIGHTFTNSLLEKGILDCIANKRKYKKNYIKKGTETWNHYQ